MSRYVWPVPMKVRNEPFEYLSLSVGKYDIVTSRTESKPSQELPAVAGGASGSGGQRISNRTLAGLFTVTSFVASGLMFLVQPMVGKLVLPLYGGAASVWNVCMLFF